MELKAINGGNIYFDTNVFIYAIEDNEHYRKHIIALFSRIQETGCKIFTSELTLAECLVKPFAANDEVSVKHYEEQIKNTDTLEVKSVTKTVLKDAAKNRASYRNKLPDAIHVATAIKSECGVFITNDSTIKTPDNLTKIVIRDLFPHSFKT